MSFYHGSYLCVCVRVYVTCIHFGALLLITDQLTTISLATLPARYGHSAVVFASQLRVFGGVDAAGIYRSEHFALTLGQVFLKMLH